MFGLGTWEMMIILAVALIFIGPNKLPELAKTLGRGVGKMRRAMSDVEREVDQAARPMRQLPSYYQQAQQRSAEQAMSEAEADAVGDTEAAADPPDYDDPDLPDEIVPASERAKQSSGPGVPRPPRPVVAHSRPPLGGADEGGGGGVPTSSEVPRPVSTSDEVDVQVEDPGDPSPTDGKATG